MIIAQALDEESTSAKHTAGQVFRDPSTGAEYVYVSASEAITQYQACSYDSSGAALKLTKTEADKLYGIGIAMGDIASGSYGWMLIGGPKTSYVSGLASCAKEVSLYTSGTAGSLDDDSSGTTAIKGILLTAANGTSTANCACFLTRRLSI
jgi:hypothetical protein